MFLYIVLSVSFLLSIKLFVTTALKSPLKTETSQNLDVIEIVSLVSVALLSICTTDGQMKTDGNFWRKGK